MNPGLSSRSWRVLLMLTVLFSSCDVPLTDPQTPAEFFERAVSAYQDGDREPARRFFVQAEEMSRAQDRNELLLQALIYQARIAYELGEVHTAIQKAQESAALARQIGDFRAEAEVRTLEGRSYRIGGLLRDAERALEDALRISTTFQERPKIIEAELALGELWLLSSDPEPSADYFSHALTGAQDLDDGVLAARALHGLATVFLRQGKDQEARNSISQALSLLEGQDQPTLSALVRLLQGEVFQREGNANAALSSYRDAVNGLRRARTGRRYEVLCLFRIGLLYQSFQRSGDAKKYFSDGLEIARREGDKIAQYYLNVHLLLADIRLMTVAQRARIAPRIVQAFTQLGSQFGDILQRPGKAFARGFAGEALRLSQSINALETLTVAAEAERSSDVAFLDPILHEPYLSALLAQQDDGRWARMLASEFLKQDRVVEALTALERQRLTSFADQLDGVALALRHPAVATTGEDIRREHADLKLWGIELSAQVGASSGADTLRRVIDAYRETEQRLLSRGNEVVKAHKNYAAIVLNNAVGLEDIRQHIPRGITMVEYIGDGPVIHILAVSRTDMLFKTIAISESTIYSRVREFEQLMLDPMVYSGEGGESSVPGMTRFAMLSTELYDMLLRPMESVIDRGIIVVPNTMIGALPLHALERQGDGGRVEFVIERMSVDYLPSWSSVMFTTQSPGRLRSIVAFGNPSGKNWSVDYELRDIRSFFRSADVYTGRDASWENMQRTKPDLLQLSSEFVPGLTSFGSFLVSEGEVTEETRLLPFEQLLELDAPPVVLLTNQSGGQFGLGPQHAVLLRMNGTSDIFLNRWNADRQAAKFFSEYFFTHLSGGLAPGDAYRQALLNLIQTREHSHPRSWAQFFHFGTG